MNCVLVKCHARTLFRRLDPIVTEPLELEYLAAVLNRLDIPWLMHDPLLDRLATGRLLAGNPATHYLLSGYNTAVPEILALAGWIRKNFPQALILVGGVQAELCPGDFMVPDVDYVFTSDALETFGRLMAWFKSRNPAAPVPPDGDYGSALSGLCWRTPEGWRRNPAKPAQGYPELEPDRAYFLRYAANTRYLDSRPVALLKTAYACPHSCDFCYCRSLNCGRYARTGARDVLRRIKNLPVSTVWLVDDCLISSLAEAEDWLAALSAEGLSGYSIIAYIRADFAAAFPETLARLASFGFRDWIIGLEAVSDESLARLGKTTAADQNRQAVAAVRAAGARLTALFLVDPDMDLKAFAELRRFVREQKIREFTVSLFTPLKGTGLWDQWRDRLLSLDPHHQDFLHVVARPTRLPLWLYRLQFWRLHLLSAARSRRLRRWLLQRTFGQSFGPSGIRQAGPPGERSASDVF